MSTRRRLSKTFNADPLLHSNGVTQLPRDYFGPGMPRVVFEKRLD